jgi:hypothetical protein
MVKKLFVAALLAVAAAVAAAPACAAGFWLGAKGDQPAVSGYDVVSYFAGTPAAGSTEFTVMHNGAGFRFASAANRDVFRASPDRYAPQFGGHIGAAHFLGRSRYRAPKRLLKPKLHQRFLRLQAYHFGTYLTPRELYIFQRDREVFQPMEVRAVRGQRHRVLMCALSL